MHILCMFHIFAVMEKKMKNIKLEDAVLKALAVQAIYANMNLQNYLEAVLIEQSKTSVIAIGKVVV